jgi:NADH dehydrogenase FAD-containing subunit
LAQNIRKNADIILKGEHIRENVKFNYDIIKDTKFDENKVVGYDTNYDYDYLVLAHGAATNTFNIEGVDKHCFMLKTDKDAEKIRNKLSQMPENAQISVIGCGLTGTEVIGTLLDYNKFRINAIDALPRPIPTFKTELSDFVLKHWRDNLVSMYMDSSVSSVGEQFIGLKNGIKLESDMSIWCGGCKNSILTDKILNNLNLNCKKGIPIDSHLLVNNTSNVWGIGDCSFSGLPPTAQVAYQQGGYLANMFNTGHYKSLESAPKFTFDDKGQIGYVGKGKSVCQLHHIKGGGNLVCYLNVLVHAYNSVSWPMRMSILSA